MNTSPANLEQRLVNKASFAARPIAQAIARSRLIEFGGSWRECSTSSATARRAIAYALFIASSLVLPYASAPGTCGISAIQRPSVSSSVSMTNRKSRLLVLWGGLCSVITSLRCRITDYDAPYGGNGGRRNSISHRIEIASESFTQRIVHAAISSLYSRFSDAKSRMSVSRKRY